MMQEWEVWLDLEVPTDSEREVVCALFARMTFSTRPMVGERITFHSPRGVGETFHLLMAWGPMPSNAISCVVDDIAHSRTAEEDGAGFATSLRFQSLAVATLSDADKVMKFLASSHGFEIDPYGVNKLDA